RRDYASMWYLQRNISSRQQATDLVQGMVARGETVPPEVLADYPHLNKPTPKAAPPASLTPRLGRPRGGEQSHEGAAGKPAGGDKRVGARPPRSWREGRPETPRPTCYRLCGRNGPRSGAAC